MARRQSSTETAVTMFVRKDRKPPPGEPTETPDGQPYSWWRARIRPPSPPDPATLDLGWTTEEDAERQRAVIEARVRLRMTPREVDTSRSSLTLKVGNARYLDHLEGLYGRSGYFVDAERALLRVGGRLGDKLITSLKDSDLKSYAAARAQDPGARTGTKISRETIWGELKTLLRCIRYLQGEGEIPRDWDLPKMPSKKVLPDNTRTRRDLTTEELDRLVRAFRAAGQPDYADLTTFSAWCPGRPEELVDLTVHDCRRILDRGLPRSKRTLYFRTTKGGEGRGWRPVAEPAFQALLRQLERRPLDQPDAPVWMNTRGDRLVYDAWHGALTRKCEAIGLDHASPYALRKYGITMLNAHFRGNLYEVAKYSGHKSIETILKNYLSAEAGKAEEAAAEIGRGVVPHLAAVEDDTPAAEVAR